MATTQKVRRRRRRSEEIKFYLVVDGTPNPEVLIQNYLWCLKQRELGRQVDTRKLESEDIRTKKQGE